MADIDIVPKHRSGHAWLWIVLAIVAVIIIAMMVTRGSSSQNRSGFLAVPDHSAPVRSAVPAGAATGMRVM